MLTVFPPWTVGARKKRAGDASKELKHDGQDKSDEGEMTRERGRQETRDIWARVGSGGQLICACLFNGLVHPLYFFLLTTFDLFKAPVQELLRNASMTRSIKAKMIPSHITDLDRHDTRRNKLHR